MNNRTSILNELRGISPVLASVPFVQPYQDVPNGYFEDLADQILIKVKEEKSAAILAQVDKTAPYQVPGNYFDTLPAIILQRIKAEEQAGSDEALEILSPLLGSLKNKTTFEVPQGYFDDISVNAIAGAKAIEFVNEELENLSPLMISLKEKQVFELPAGYFDAFPATMLSKARASNFEAKVISISKTRRVIQFAVAAAVIGFVAIMGWFYSNQPALPGPSAGTEIANNLHQLSDTELQGYAENESVIIAEPFTTSTEVFTAEDVKDLLADISDEELQKYIDEETGVNKSYTN